MRALVISAWPPWPLDDGARLLLHHQLEQLADRHEVTLVAVGRHGDANHVERRPRGLATLRTLPPPTSRTQGYVAARQRATRRLEPIEVGHVATPTLREVLDETLRHPFDVVHLFGWGTAQLAESVRPRPVVHSAIDAWSLGRDTARRPSLLRLFEFDQAFLVRRHERRHYPSCDAVVVVSEQDAAHLRALAPEARVEVVSNGVDPGPEPVAGDDGRTVGFHGVMSTRPNAEAAHHLVRQVLPRIRQRVEDARALIVGRNPASGLVAAAADADVDVTGAVDDVRPWLEQMSVYVAPLTSGTGLKNKVLEAMAAARPVVATRHALGGIGPGDGVVAVESMAELADAAVDLLTDAEARTELGLAARVRVLREFSWARSAERIDELWRELAEHP